MLQHLSTILDRNSREGKSASGVEIFPSSIIMIILLYCLYPRYPDTEQLQTVYGTYLLPVLQHSLSSHPFWGSTARIHALAGSMVQVYEQVSFSTLPDNLHRTQT